MDHMTSLKCPDEFFNIIMFIDLNNKTSHTLEDNICEWKILDNYAAQTLDAKYK